MSALAAGRRWVVAGGADGQLHILTAAEGRHVGSWRLSGYALEAVAINTDETLAAAGSSTGEVRLLRLPGGEELASWQPHRDHIGSLAFAGPDVLATGGYDHAVRLWRWDGRQLKELLGLPTPAAVQRLAFTPDCRRLLVLLQNERALRLWHLDRLDARLAELGLRSGLPSFLSPSH